MILFALLFAATTSTSSCDEWRSAADLQGKAARAWQRTAELRGARLETIYGRQLDSAKENERLKKALIAQPAPVVTEKTPDWVVPVWIASVAISIGGTAYLAIKLRGGP